MSGDCFVLVGLRLRQVSYAGRRGSLPIRGRGVGSGPESAFLVDQSAGRPMLRLLRGGRNSLAGCRSTRRTALPRFAGRAVRQRIRKIGIAPAETLLFSTRLGTLLTTNNVRRKLRDVMDGAGISGMTPHRLRLTAATAINESSSLLLAAELPGHSDSKITIQHCIQSKEAVNPITAELPDATFG